MTDRAEGVAVRGALFAALNRHGEAVAAARADVAYRWEHDPVRRLMASALVDLDETMRRLFSDDQ